MPIPLGILAVAGAGAAGGGGFLTVYGSTGTEETRIFLTRDSGGNIYTGGYTDAGESAGAYRGNITQILSTDGSIGWSKKITGDNTQRWYQVSAGSVNSISIVGSNSSPTRIIIANFDSTGSLNWQKQLTNPDSIGAYGVRVNSSDVTVAVANVFQGGDAMYVQSFDDTGTDVGKRVIVGPNIFTAHAAFDSSGNIHACTAQGHIMKLNTTGSSITWQKALSTSFTLRDIDVDSSGNVAVVGDTGGEGYLIVLTSAGAISWQTKFTGSLNAVRFDSAGNIVAQGSGTGSTSTDTLLRKYNSSGTLLWQRSIDNQDTGVTAYAIGNGGLAIDAEDNIFIAGRWNSSSTGLGSGDWYVMKYPGDGSYTGTFAIDGKDVEIAASSLTDSTPTLTVSNTAHTAASGTYTIGTGSQSISAITLTEYTATFS